MVRNYQAAGREQGDLFEEMSAQALSLAGFTIDARRERFGDAGIEVDIIATNEAGISFYITCKGSWQGSRPGCERTDTLKKALAEAMLLHQHGWGPVLLLTSHRPTTPSGTAMLQSIDPEILFDAVNPLTDGKRLRWLAQATEADLARDLNARRNLFTTRQRGYGRWQQG
jgi:hypothetical protein